MATDHVLSDLFNEMYLLATQIEAGNIELPAPEPLKNRLTQRFEAARKKAVDLGFTPADVEDGQYAVAAFLDEVIQFSDWPGKAELAAYPLQRALFSENIAGANFFERLAEVRRRSSAALEVYYDCITLGFRGQYHIGNQEELEELVEDLRQELTDGASMKRLSPHGERPEDVAETGKGFPFVPIAILSVALSVLITFVLYFVLTSARSDTVDLIRIMTRN
jgi:type VI secretion system protein ImpK